MFGTFSKGISTDDGTGVGAGYQGQIVASHRASIAGSRDVVLDGCKVFQGTDSIGIFDLRYGYQDCKVQGVASVFIVNKRLH